MRSTGEGWTFIRGNAISELAKLPDESVDAFVTDPPYGMDYRPGWGRPTQKRSGIKGDGQREAIRLWRDWVGEAYRASKPDTAHVVFGTWRSPWMQRVLARHFRVRACVVWRKPQWGGGLWIRPQWELFFVLFKGRPPRRGPDVGDVWDCPRVQQMSHPCEKPTKLLRRCIELVSDPGQLVVDPFAGIVSTGVAAIECGRQFLGIELDPKFYPIGRRRLIESAKHDPE